MSRSRRFGRISLVAGLLAFLAILYFLGPAEIIKVLRETRYTYLLLTLFPFTAGAFLRIYKWSLMRDRMSAPINLSELSSTYFASKFWGMVSPMRSGEVLPVLLKDHRQGKMLSIILFDRVLETFQTLVVFSVLFFLFYGVLFDARTGLALTGILGVLAIFTCLLVRQGAAEFALSVAEHLVGRLPGSTLAVRSQRMLSAARREMEEFYGAVRSYYSAGFTLWVFSLTFIAWGIDMCIWLLVFKAAGVSVPLITAVTSILVYVMLAAALPIPAGLGVSDLGLALVLSRFGYIAEAGGVIILIRLTKVVLQYSAYLISHTLLPDRGADVKPGRT